MHINEIGNLFSVKTISFAIAFCVIVMVIGALIVVKIVKTPAAKKQLMEYNSYKGLAYELKETNKEMRGELAVLKEKVSSIEKMLKEVE